MNSSYVKISNGLIHFLHEGTGPPIFLFHASPMSARSLAPLIRQLSDTHKVIAIDTPGYGKSDLPLNRPYHIKEYVDLVLELQDLLGLPKVGIYGSATGAQIGIRYALEYPDRVAHLFLDNTAHFTEQERQDIFAHYFPDFTPRADGSHLPLIWDNVINLFQYFPWCFKEEKYKLNGPLPPIEVLHGMSIDYIRSGAEYDWAYKVAFEHEIRENVYALNVPTHIFKWARSILGSYTDRIFEKQMPDNITHGEIAADEDRYKALANTINNKYHGPSATPDPELFSAPSDDIHPTPSGLGTFPKPELSGQYLTEAWKDLDKLLDSNASTDKKSAIFIKWAQSIL